MARGSRITALKIGITFAILSFVGKIRDSREVLKMIAKGSPRMCREHFRRRIGHEYKP